MDKEKAAKILAFYRTIDSEVQLNDRMIAGMEDEYYSASGGEGMDGMPKAKGKISNPVQNIALNIPDWVRETIKMLHKQNKTLIKIKVEIFKELNRLTYIERVIVVSCYIEEQKWSQIAESAKYSERQCRNIRKTALEKLAVYFKRNKAVATHDFGDL